MTEDVFYQDVFYHIHKPDSRKCMVLRIPQRAMINLLLPLNNINVIYKLDLPNDVKVVRVWVDHEYRAISYLLESESFKEVEEGLKAPVLEFSDIVILKYVALDDEND